MKKGLLFSVITLVISLACSVACFAGCSFEMEYDSNAASSSAKHTHNYTLVSEVPSTCKTQGNKAHYTCDGCTDLFVLSGGEYVVTEADDLKLPLAAHTYDDHDEVPATCIAEGTKAYSECTVCEKLFVDVDGVKTETTATDLVITKVAHTFTSIEITSPPTKLAYYVDDILDPAGLVVKKVCSTDGCSGVTATASEITIVYGESQTALIKGQTSVTVKVGELTATLSGLTVTAPKTNVVLPAIASKTYNGSLQTADVKESEFYDVTTNNGGTDVGSYDVVLTIKADKWAEYAFNGSQTATVKFEITKADNTISGATAMTLTCADRKKDNFGISTITANGAAITLKVKNPEDGEFYNLDETDYEAGKSYTIKAFSAATVNYNAAESAEFTVTFEHALDYYKEVEGDSTIDQGYCSCNAVLDGENGTVKKVYNKVVTADNILEMKENAKLKISLEGIEYSTIKSLSCGTTPLDATSMTIEATADWISGTHGVKTFTAVVEDADGFEHSVNFDVIFATGIVTDWSTFLHTFQSHTGNYADGVFGMGTYYVLGCDIEAGSLESHVYEGDTYKRITAVPDTEAENYIWWTDIDGVVNGFAGVLDGRGHVITNIVADTGIFGVMKGGTVKNIDFTVSDWTVNYSAASLFGPLFNVTLENVNITFNKAMELATNDVNGTFGIITGQHGLGNTFKDINVYAPGSTLDCLVMQSGLSTGNGVKSSTFENINFYAKSFERFGSGISPEDMAEKVPGVKFSAVDDYDIQSATIGTDGADITVNVPEKLEGYTVKSIRYGNVSLSSGEKIISSSKLLGAIKGAKGTYALFMTLEKEGHEIRLPIYVSFDGYDVDDIYVEETSFEVEIKKPALFTDYEITDITANGTSVKTSDGKIDVSSFVTAVNGEYKQHSVVVTLTKDGTSLEMTVNATLVTEVITSWEQLLYRVTYRKGAEDKFGEGKYYVLGNDIKGGNVENEFSYKEEKFVNPPKDNWAATSTDAGKGFFGTLDGLGHSITDIAFCSYSIFGALRGTVKNLIMSGTTYSWAGNCSIFAGGGAVYDATIENVTLHITSDGSNEFSNYAGLIARDQVARCTFTNFVVHAEGIKFTYLISGGAMGAEIGNAYGISSNGSMYTNCKFYVADYDYVASTGTTNNSMGGLKVYTDVQTVELSGETVSINLPTALTGSDNYAFRVMLNGKVINGTTIEGVTASFAGQTWNAIDFTELSVEQIKAAIGDDYDKTYELVYDVSASGGKWTYESQCVIVRVKFTKPASSESAE